MRLKALLFLVSLPTLLMLTPIAAYASVRISVHIPTQRMEVTVDGVVRHTWPVSTAAGRKVTPTGTFKPYWLSPKHRSSKYRWAPMPHAVFYDGDYAIHGTLDEHLIGRPASKGCVRLTRENAKVLFGLVREYGMDRVTIEISK